MADNIRDNSGLPYFYSSHEHEDENEEDKDTLDMTTSPRWYGYGYWQRRPEEMETCGYCGERMPGCYVEPISVVRHGKSRDIWRCEKCREDMKSYKPTDK